MNILAISQAQLSSFIQHRQRNATCSYNNIQPCATSKLFATHWQPILLERWLPWLVFYNKSINEKGYVCGYTCNYVHVKISDLCITNMWVAHNALCLTNECALRHNEQKYWLILPVNIVYSSLILTKPYPGRP